MAASRSARNACFPCSAQKRACDRQLPICSRCAQHNVRCGYSQPMPLQDSSTELSILNFNTTALPPLFTLSLLQLRSIRKKQNQTATGHHELDAVLTSLLFNTLEGLGLGLQEVIDIYFQSTHQWLPIIHPVTIRQKAAVLRNTPCAKVACLLFHFLLVLPPCSSNFLSDIDVLSCLYHDCKTLCSLFQAHYRNELTTIQSGLLLALYEQSRGCYSDAYVTLTTCTSLGYISRLNIPSVGPIIVEDEGMRVWWAIYFLGILNNYSSKECDRLPIIREASVGEVLPGDDVSWSESSCPTYSASPATLSFSREQSPTNPGRFSHLIQAVFSLQRVLQLTRKAVSLTDSSFEDELWKFDSYLQQEIHDALSISQLNVQHSYSVLSIYLLSIIELHTTRLLRLSNQNNIENSTELSIAALEMALKVVGDLLHADGLGNILDVKQMPLTALLLLKNAGSTVLLLESQYEHQTGDVLQTILEVLRARASGRWCAADDIRLELQKARDRDLHYRTTTSM